jgi:hypothetical protein
MSTATEVCRTFLMYFLAFFSKQAASSDQNAPSGTSLSFAELFEELSSVQDEQKKERDAEVERQVQKVTQMIGTTTMGPLPSQSPESLALHAEVTKHYQLRLCCLLFFPFKGKCQG